MPATLIPSDNDANTFFEAHRLFFTAPLFHQEIFASLYATPDEQAAIADYSNKLKTVLYKEYIQVPLKEGMSQRHPLIYAWKRADFEFALQNKVLCSFLIEHRTHPAIEIWHNKINLVGARTQLEALFEEKLAHLEALALQLRGQRDPKYIQTTLKPFQAVHLNTLARRSNDEVLHTHLPLIEACISCFQNKIEISKIESSKKNDENVQSDAYKTLSHHLHQLEALSDYLSPLMDDDSRTALAKFQLTYQSFKTSYLMGESKQDIAVVNADLLTQCKHYQKCVNRNKLLDKSGFNEGLAQLHAQLSRLNQQKKIAAGAQAKVLLDKLTAQKQRFMSGKNDCTYFVTQCRTLIKNAKQSDLCEYTSLEKFLNALAIILTFGLAAVYTGGLAVIKAESMKEQERLDEALHLMKPRGG